MAIFMEILAPYFKAYFTPIFCTAGVCKVQYNTIFILTFYDQVL